MILSHYNQVYFIKGSNELFNVNFKHHKIVNAQNIGLLRECTNCIELNYTNTFNISNLVSDYLQNKMQ